MSLCWEFLVHKCVMFCLCEFPVLSFKHMEVPRQGVGGCRVERCSEGGKRRWMDRRCIGVRDDHHSGSVRKPQETKKGYKCDCKLKWKETWFISEWPWSITKSLRATLFHFMIQKGALKHHFVLAWAEGGKKAWVATTTSSPMQCNLREN